MQELPAWKLLVLYKLSEELADGVCPAGWGSPYQMSSAEPKQPARRSISRTPSWVFSPLLSCSKHAAPTLSQWLPWSLAQGCSAFKEGCVLPLPASSLEDLCWKMWCHFLESRAEAKHPVDFPLCCSYRTLPLCQLEVYLLSSIWFRNVCSLFCSFVWFLGFCLFTFVIVCFYLVGVFFG